LFSKKTLEVIEDFQRAKAPLSLGELIPDEVLALSKSILLFGEGELTEKHLRNYSQDHYRSYIRKKVGLALEEFLLLFDNVDSIESTRTHSRPLIDYQKMDRVCYIWISHIRKRYSFTNFLGFFGAEEEKTKE
jgi:hypothetical protein